MITPNQLSQPTDNERIAYLQQQVEQMQALAALGELTGTATHEFNNVLMTILNYAKLGLRHTDDATREKSLTKILAAAERAAKICRTILATARNRSDDLQPTDIGEIINDSLELLQREMRQYRISVETQLQETPLAQANGNQIQRVLLNLLINARQAMPDGGSIWVKLHPSTDGQWVVLTIQDSGCGIDPERLPHIFDPFYSTKKGPDASGKGGTGLGLSACADVVVAHNGRIRVESTVGCGTAFIIRLPVAARSEEAAA